MWEETPEEGQAVERVAALDIGKAELVCCVRVPHPSGSGRRVQQVRAFTTVTRSLPALGGWVAGFGGAPSVLGAASGYL